MPHGGGKRLDPKSDDYKLLVRWISQGMPYGKDTDPKLVSIEVQPKQNTMKLKGEQQLKVLARYSDGYVRDVTRSALYEPNDKSMAETSEDGLVKLFDIPGDVAVMVRYQGKVAVFSAIDPARRAGRESARRRGTSSTNRSSRSSSRSACRPRPSAMTRRSSAA